MAAKEKGALIDYSTAHDDRAKMAEYLQASSFRQPENEISENKYLQQNRVIFFVIALLLLGTGLFFVLF